MFLCEICRLLIYLSQKQLFGNEFFHLSPNSRLAYCKILCILHYYLLLIEISLDTTLPL